jgi:alpha/beta superfamily hydrolase
MSFFSILPISVILIGVFYAAICYIFAQLTLNPKRQPIEFTPADYGLEYENIEFQSADNLQIKGWFIPGNPRKVLLVTHPMYCNRHGFLTRNKSVFMAANTDIELVLAMKAFNQAGYSILTFDFRNHGESENGISGVGIHEYQDVLGAVEYLKQRKDVADADLGLVGFCMGANSIIVALSKGADQFSKARCLVAIQPISMAVFVRSYVKSIYTRLGLIVLPLMEFIRRHLGGLPLRELSPGSYIKDITLPTLYVQGRRDPWTELSDIQGFYESASQPKEFWWLETTQSRLEAYQYVSENPQPLIDFINSYMQ